jgi:hypothetical protein
MNWMQWIPDRAPTIEGMAWDHRWGLPAAIYAITMRMAVLKAFDPGTPTAASQRCKEAKKYATLLADVFNRIYSGIKQSPVKAEQYPRFSQGELPAAAADINSGYFVERRITIGNTRNYVLPPELYPPHLRPCNDFESLKHNVGIFNPWWFNHICVKNGLPELLIFISRLQN